MCVFPVWRIPVSLSRIRAVATFAAFIALLLTLHAVPARASSTVAASALPPAEVQEVLSGIPLEDLSATQLGEVLSQLPGLGTLPPAQLQEALTKAIEELAGEGGTLGQLSNPSELIANLEGQLKEVLSLPELLGLLKGQSLLTLLTGGLGEPEASQLLGGLLSSTAEPNKLLEELLAALDTEKLDALLGTTLSGGPVSASTVSELAGQLGTTDEGLAEALNTTSSELPAGALALTAPLTNGKTLAVLNGLSGLDLGLLGPTQEEEAGGGSGSGGSGGIGGSGGSGGSGSGAGSSGGSGGSSSGTPAGGTTVVVNELAQPTTSGTQASAAKVKILSRRVRGHAVTLLLQVSSAGTVTVSGRGLRSQRKQASRAERVTVRASLTKAGVATLRGHSHRLRMTIRASFAAVGGPSSSASTTVAFG